MARVSQAHLDARRRQILDGAARCFVLNGFHATSMQDVLREADLSAGAVYRYFSGKEELIVTIAAEAFAAIRVAFESAATQSPPPPPDELLGTVLGHVFVGPDGLAAADSRAFPRLVLQVWAETLRSEELSARLRQSFGEMLESWVKVVEAYVEAGLMRADLPVEQVARTLMATVQGFIAQQALFGDVSVEALRNGLRALMSMDLQSAS